MTRPTPIPQATSTVLSAAIRHAAASTSPACILDSRGAYLFVNDPWTSLEAGRDAARAEALVGASIIDHIEGEDARTTWREELKEMLAGGGCSRTLASEHNTPTLARLASTRVFPLANADAVLGLVLVRTIVRERPISDLYAVSRTALAPTSSERASRDACA